MLARGVARSASSAAAAAAAQEWHQKLHNNTTPDDIAICEALIAYMDAGLDVAAYWKRLAADNITRERLLSFDRPIHNEPSLSADQAGPPLPRATQPRARRRP